MTTPAMPAARVDDPIKHKSFLGAIGGALVGGAISYVVSLGL